MSRLKEKYEKEVQNKLSSEFSIKNSMAVPKITKVVVNAGIGDALKNKEALAQAKEDLAKITGQTLRGRRMYDFLDRLFSIVLPRLRDFRGLSTKSFDQGGNYTLGIEEHTVFLEIDLANYGTRGLEISIVTNTKDKKKAKRLLELMGMPFEKK
jgi:large subunit ribosomal protein L5